MDLQWLDAPADAVRAADTDAEETPRWVPTRRRVLVSLNALALVWSCTLSILVVAGRVDQQEGDVRGADVLALVVTGVIALAWTAASVPLYRWSRRPSPATRLRRGRRRLTAAAGGFRHDPRPTHAFRSMLTDHPAGVRHYPRFVAEGAEFGTVRPRVPRSQPWQYVRATLAAPLPHLVLDARANDRLRGRLPEVVADHQRARLEGAFDETFRVFAPSGYVSDALYVLTPDVMVELLDHARNFDVEIVDDNVVFFRATSASWDDTRSWQAVDAVLSHVAPRLIARSRQYVDERVEGQSAVHIALGHEADALAGQNPRTLAWRPEDPQVGVTGRRLRSSIDQRGWPASARVVGWFLLSTAATGLPVLISAIALLGIFGGP